MNLDNFESIDVEWPTDEKMVKKLKELQADPSKLSSSQVEYWNLGGKTIINRVILT
jgi:hypothetical protein